MTGCIDSLLCEDSPHQMAATEEGEWRMKCLNLSPVTEPVWVTQSRIPSVDIDAIAETHPRTRSFFETTSLPRKLYPNLLTQFLLSAPVSSTNTSISGWSWKTCMHVMEILCSLYFTPLFGYHYHLLPCDVGSLQKSPNGTGVYISSSLLNESLLDLV